jgi:transcriptional regulator with XRE-family HTH domain
MNNSMDCGDKTSIIGKFILERRRERSLSQRALARLCRVDQKYIARVESGESPASPRLLCSLAVHLECDADTLQLMAGHLPDDVMQILCRNPRLCGVLRALDSAGEDL